MSVFLIFKLFLFSFLVSFSLFYAMVDTNVIDLNLKHLILFTILFLVLTALLIFVSMVDYGYLL